MLLSESEWEYAARAGTTGPFHFGETISTDQANYDGVYTYGPGRKGVYRDEDGSGGLVSFERIRASRHARECVGMGRGLLA